MRPVPVRVVPMVIAVLCGTLAITGCGGGGGPADPDGVGDPSGVGAPNGATSAAADPESVEGCDLLTREEAAAVAGNPVQEGKMLGPICVWEPVEYEDPSHLQVSIFFRLVPPDAAITAEQDCESSVEVMVNPEPEDGFGDRSYWEYMEAPLGNSGLLLVCLANGTMSVGAVGGRPESELWQVVTEIATIALGRL